MESMVMKKSFWRNKRVLLTGHTGFKGSWLTLWLLSLGADVWGYSLQPQDFQPLFNDLFSGENMDPENESNFHHHIGDIRDLSSLCQFCDKAKPDIVFHLAAQPLVQESYSNPLDTWEINVQGSLNLLAALTKTSKKTVAIVMITTDKVYLNNEWDYGYREDDPLGGHDPYSASKAASEIAIASWRSSFAGSGPNQNPNLYIATARAGNVVGGGDWSPDRIIPDAIRALTKGQPIALRNPKATRPWQHVLEPLSGYLLLASRLYTNKNDFCKPYNFGPMTTSNRTVQELIDEILQYWPGSCTISPLTKAPEAQRLHLNSDKAFIQLGWSAKWEFEATIQKTVQWYLNVKNGASPRVACLNDIKDFETVNNILSFSPSHLNPSNQ